MKRQRKAKSPGTRKKAYRDLESLFSEADVRLQEEVSHQSA